MNQTFKSSSVCYVSKTNRQYDCFPLEESVGIVLRYGSTHNFHAFSVDLFLNCSVNDSNLKALCNKVINSNDFNYQPSSVR